MQMTVLCLNLIKTKSTFGPIHVTLFRPVPFLIHLPVWEFHAYLRPSLVRKGPINSEASGSQPFPA